MRISDLEARLAEIRGNFGDLTVGTLDDRTPTIEYEPELRIEEAKDVWTGSHTVRPNEKVLIIA